MKKISSYVMLFAAAAMALVSCAKESTTTKSEEAKTVKLVVNAGSPETKTVIDGTSVTWSESGESLYLGEVIDDGTPTEYTSTEYELADENKSATFSFDLTENTSGSSYEYYAFYPSSAISLVSKYYEFAVTLPTSQTVTTSSPDPEASIIMATSTATEQPSSLDLSFSHLAAYGKMTLKSVSDIVSGASSVVVTFYAEGEKVSGEYWYYYGGDSEGTFTASNNGTNPKVDVDASSLSVDSNGNLVVCFACWPFDLASGESFTVSITADGSTYSRTVELSDSQELAFVAGQVSKFSVSGFASESKTTYTLVTDSDELTDGSEVIIVNSDGAYAMSTTINTSSNYFGQTAVTVSDNKIELGSTDAVEVFTLSAGSETNTIAFAGTTNTGYLNVPSDKNVLNVTDSKAAASSWNVVIKSDGTTNIYNVSYPTREIRYNNYNNADRFAAYAGTQNPVFIYKNGDSGSTTKLITKYCNTPLIDCASNTVTITCADPDAATIYYTTDGSEPSESSTKYTEAFSISETTTVKAIAIADGYENSEVASKECQFISGTDYSTVHTSNVTLAANATGASKVTKSTVALEKDGETYDALKAGTSSAAGVVTFTVPSGTTKLHFHAAGWTGKTPTIYLSASDSNVTLGTTSIELTGDTGVSGNTTAYTLASYSGATMYYTVTLENVTSETTITIKTTASEYRFLLWGVNAE